MTTEGAFAGLAVLDLAGPEADYCGRLFADLGAEVIKIEPPGGSEARRRPPIVGEPPVSLYFDHYNRNKRGVVVDVDSDDGAERLRRLVSHGDGLDRIL